MSLIGTRELCSSLFLIVLVMIATIYSVEGGSNGTSVFDLLPTYRLPSGLLPNAVASYTLEDDGRFVVDLDRPSCYIQFGSNLVFYDRKITGTLKIGSIRDLHGVQVQRLFLWLGVDEIKVDLPPSDFIYFQVGWISKRLPVGDFREVQSCQDRKSFQNRIKQFLGSQNGGDEPVVDEANISHSAQFAL
ncbi:uncharacterized protein LOC144701942 [Wolffia australiana]